MLVYFAWLVLRLEGFESGSCETSASSGVRSSNKSEEGLFPITALMWCDCSNFSPYLPSPLNGPTWRFVHALSQDSLPYHRDNSRKFPLCISISASLIFDLMRSSRERFRFSEARWGGWGRGVYACGGGGGIRYSRYAVILCLFESFWSKWNYRVQNGPRMRISWGDFSWAAEIPGDQIHVQPQLRM